MELKYDAVDYLKKQTEPWIQYQMSKHLGAGLKEQEEKKQKLLLHPKVIEMINDISKWPEPPLVRHSDAWHPVHIMQVLLDMGFSRNDSFINEAAEKILKHQDKSGVLLSLLNIPESYGGTGVPTMGWMNCDFPVLLYILLRLGMEKDSRVKAALDFLIENAFENGWRCDGSFKKFRGPGRKEDYCPISTALCSKGMLVCSFSS